MKVRYVAGAVLLVFAAASFPGCFNNGKVEKEKVVNKQAKTTVQGLRGRARLIGRSIGEWWQRSVDKLYRSCEGSHPCLKESAEDYFNRVGGVCPYCKKEYKRPSSLRKHVINKHSEELEKEEKK